MLFDILKVGAVSCFSPLQSGADDHHLHPHAGAVRKPKFWPGYGIGARPGIHAKPRSQFASRDCVGCRWSGWRSARPAALHGRARRHRPDRRLGLLYLGRRGSEPWLRFFPDLWVNIFTHDPGVGRRQPAISVKPRHRFYGLPRTGDPRCISPRRGAAQSSGTSVRANRAAAVVRGPAAAGGLSMQGATAANFFALAAASMVVLGTLSAASVMLTRWGTESAQRFRKIRPVLS